MEKPSMNTVEGLRLALQELGLCTKGQKGELKQRFRKAQKKAKEQEEKNLHKVEVEQPKEFIQPYDYYLFFDVEATCVENGGFKYPNEIIEFPVVLVDGKTFDIVDTFRSYVKPTVNPVLSDFCIQLTGITQDIIDNSPPFIDVLNQFQRFLGKYGLFQSFTAVFVTDGPFDIRDFITKQLDHSNIDPRPIYFSLPWVNIRELFRKHYNFVQNKNISGMLAHLNMEFKGREHSGLDDARNLAYIAKRMSEDGCKFKPNCKLQNTNRVRHRKRR
ncbi:ribonuclease H-like domain-containing protein [Sporodiniella umbellata]|nr:ribonuclease H-like domain-containing protein [Sporodiniella umbellata]